MLGLWEVPFGSEGLLPMKLLASDTVPATPLSRLPQVTAPRVPFHNGLTTK